MNLRNNNIFTSSLLLILITLLGLVLRIYKITSIPPALHGDELGVGYNAYSLLKSGRDEYGWLFPLVFRNDFTPLVIYLTVPFIWILGLTEFATRLPSVIFSVFTIPVIYLFIIQLFNNKKLALLTAFLVTISSWDIRIARIGVGITFPLLFQLLGTTLFLKSFKKSLNKWFMVYSFLFFSLSTFSYQSPKMTTPLLVIALLFIYRIKIKLKNNLRFILILFLLFIILPSIQYLFSVPIKEMRFTGISVFTVWRSTPPLSLLKLLQMIGVNYVKHFDPTILFFDNSNLRYHQLPQIGLFYPWQIIFIIYGLLKLLTKITKNNVKLIFLWLLVSPTASALTTGVPYANISRALMIMPIIELFCAYGILILSKKIRKIFPHYLKFIYLIIIITCFVNFKSFINQYYINTKEDYSEFWGKHLKETALSILPMENKVNKIIISETLSPQTYMYLLFYGKKEPAWLFNINRHEAKIVGYDIFGKYEIRQINWLQDKNLSNTLIVGTPLEIPNTDKLIKEISSKEGKVLVKIIHNEN